LKAEFYYYHNFKTVLFGSAKIVNGELQVEGEDPDSLRDLITQTPVHDTTGVVIEEIAGDAFITALPYTFQGSYFWAREAT
jgi:hypothetical protein